MGNDNAGQTLTVTAPKDFKYEEGQPIQFEVPLNSIDLAKFAPKDVAEKPYFKDKVKTTEDLFKLLDGSQKLLGERPKFTAAPAADASQEDWDAYLASQRGAKPDDYAFEEDPNAPEELKAPEEFKKEVKQMFYDAGVNPTVAKRLAKGYDGLMMKLYKAKKDGEAAIDKKFMELVKPIVGEGKAAEASFARSKEVMAYLLPKELHDYIGKVNNEGLAVIAALTKAVEKKYMKEDELPGGGAQGGGTTKGELQTKARALMGEIAKMDNMDPQRAVKQKEVDALYVQIAAIK